MPIPHASELSHAEWLGLLLDREMTERQDRRLKARLRFARLRHQATIEDVDYRAPRGLDRALFLGYGPGERLSIGLATRNDFIYRNPAVILIDQLKAWRRRHRPDLRRGCR
jgi:hypothetical protein